MDTKKVINNQEYELQYIKTFRHTLWQSSSDRFEHTEELVDAWLTGTTQGKWFFKKAIDIGWEEHLDQSTYELIIKVKGYLQPKHRTEYALKFLDNFYDSYYN